MSHNPIVFFIALVILGPVLGSVPFIGPFLLIAALFAIMMGYGIIRGD